MAFLIKTCETLNSTIGDKVAILELWVKLSVKRFFSENRCSMKSKRPEAQVGVARKVQNSIIGKAFRVGKMFR